MKEVVDYLEELIDGEDGPDFMNEVDRLYIEPPEENDGNVSGEDDANENESGTVDDLARGQLNAGCELVLRNGQHTNTLDFQEEEENANLEYVLVFVIHESQLDLSHDQPTQVFEYEPMETAIDGEEPIEVPPIVIEPF